jgi:hypothetical protein
MNWLSYLSNLVVEYANLIINVLSQLIDLLFTIPQLLWTILTIVPFPFSLLFGFNLTLLIGYVMYKLVRGV